MAARGQGVEAYEALLTDEHKVCVMQDEKVLSLIASYLWSILLYCAFQKVKTVDLML